jgi:hypothetical protein
LRRKDEQREHYEHKECQYKGTIEDDEKSIVAVSLCDGMVSFQNDLTNFLNLFDYEIIQTRGRKSDLDTKYIRIKSLI